MKHSNIDPSSKIINCKIKQTSKIREYCTLHSTTVGAYSRIYERVSIKRSQIGKRVDINVGTYIEFAKIADGVMVGPNCSIVGVTHKFTKRYIERKEMFKKIVIGEGTFLGAGVIVLPGRTIGSGSIIGAGAVISKDIPDFSVVIGTPPNQIIKPLSTYLEEKSVSKSVDF